MWKQGFSPGLTCLCCFSLFSPYTDKCAFARAVVLAAGEPGHERRETLGWQGYLPSGRRQDQTAA